MFCSSSSSEYFSKIEVDRDRAIAGELTLTSLKELDAIEPTFLKMVMGLPTNASNTLTLEMAVEQMTLAEELNLVEL